MFQKSKILGQEVMSIQKSNEPNLPTEILFRIFQLLSPKDLKTVVLVCKLWRDLGEDPSFWTWSVVKIDSEEDFQKLNIGRLQQLQEIKVTHGNGTTICMACLDQVKWGCPWIKYGTELCKAILEMPKVKRISGLECKGISGVGPKLFVSLLNRQEKLFVYNMNPQKLELLHCSLQWQKKLM